MRTASSLRKLGLWIVIGPLVIHVAGCAGSRRPVLIEQPLPANVLAIAREARAFAVDATGPERGTAVLDTRPLQQEIGKFRTGRVLVFDAQRRPLESLELVVASDGSIEFPAQRGQQFLLYPDTSDLLRPTYAVLCKLRELQLPAQLVPKICTQILCAEQPLYADELLVRVPELANHTDAKALGSLAFGGFGGLGGFGGGGSICDQCLQPGSVQPDPGCRGVPIPEPMAVCGGGDRIVFTRQVAGTTGTRIHAMSGNATNEIVLSQPGVSDSNPDVDLRGERIVFSRSSGLFTMNIDGSNIVAIPGTSGASNPVWAREVMPHIVFEGPAGDTRAIFIVNLDGSGLKQVTFPVPGERDMMPAVLDGKRTLFVRNFAGADGADQELFIVGLFNDGEAPVQLTTMTDAAVNFPAAGHDGNDPGLLAFVVSFGPFAPSRIRVARLGAAGLDMLQDFVPGQLIEHNIFELDFSSNNQCLFVAAQARESSAQFTRMELFTMSLDGSGLLRLTENAVVDGSPSTVTQIGVPQN
jgi:hypothetical protein